MFSATFIFDKLEFDDAFFELDEKIALAARNSKGYIGEEAWEDPKTGRLCNVYYWEGQEGLLELMGGMDHQSAKRQNQKWLKGYQVVIAEVKGCYGSEGYEHVLAHRPLAWTPAARQVPPGPGEGADRS